MLAELAALTGNSGHSDAAEAALASMRAKMAQTPFGFARWLSALDFVLSEPSELAIVRADALPMLYLVRSTYRPNLVVAAASVNDASSAPLLVGRLASRRRGDDRPPVPALRVRAPGPLCG